MQPREFKDRIYSEFARIGKVLASPKRIELVDLLSQSPKSVDRLAKETNMSVANTSKHLQALLEARLVTFMKEKNFVIYQLANPKVIDLLFALKGVAEEQIAEVNLLRHDYIVRPKRVQTMELGDWFNIKEDDELILLDVRPKVEYDHGHLEHALSIPMEELQEVVHRLPKDKTIIAYCRGAYCVYATEAVEFLQANGYTAYRLEGGFHEWTQFQATQMPLN